MGKYQDFFDGTGWYGAVGIQNLRKPLSKKRKRLRPITAYHVFWTAPHFAHYPEKPFGLDDYELATAKVSAKAWRRYNGSICLITDAVGAEYFRAQGMDAYYDEILPILESHSCGLDVKKYWAAGKLLALSQVKTPCVILDMDMIVWQPLKLGWSKLTVTHRESLSLKVYPDTSFFDMSADYTYPSGWDMEEEAANTSILYIADEKLKKYYVAEALRFMEHELDTPNIGARCMVFAEQRILPMCAKELGVRVNDILKFGELEKDQDLITHVWSAKPLLQNEKEAAEEYVRLCEKIDGVL